eukprot:PLAT6801.1.p1 GENE.PLAT6801.1~~PLAT6801.1.p1  ORF type:complete len:798 (+),score=388.86 PLAT6801.1:43-2436(+)
MALPGESALSLTLQWSYAGSWGVWEGVRELVQNWHDGALSSCSDSGEALVYRQQGRLEDEGKEEGCGEKLLVQRSLDGATVASLSYDADKEELLLVNRGVGLGRTVLLLGYSAKASHKDVAGQFGEGMKVGTLALLRSGTTVSMSTRAEHWRFAIAEDERFHQRVLTVFISPRSSTVAAVGGDAGDCGELDEGDTITRLGGLPAAKWAELRKRFLFLSPVESDACVETMDGRLLLSREHAGQLFVKGIWITNLSGDGLYSGVDLADLRLDRDRRAVMHMSDIEHRVSAMWARAIVVRPDLTERFLSLMSRPDAPVEVRHADFYLKNESKAVDHIVSAFFRRHGDSALPLLNSSDASTLRSVQSKLDRKLVLCNAGLMALLQSSSRVSSVDALLAAAAEAERRRVPASELTDSERASVKHTLALLAVVADGGVLPSMTDVWDVPADSAAVRAGEYRLQLSRFALSADWAHARSPFAVCDDGSGACCCAATLLAVSALPAVAQLLADGSAAAVAAGGSLWRWPDVRSAELALMSSLAAAACGRVPPPCEAAHGGGGGGLGEEERTVYERRLEAAQEQLARVGEQMEADKREQMAELEKLRSEVRSLEKEAIAADVREMNEEHRREEAVRVAEEALRAEFAASIARQREHVAESRRAAEARSVAAARTLKWTQRRLAEVEQLAAAGAESAAARLAATELRLQRCQRLLIVRAEQLALLRERGSSGGDGDGDAKLDELVAEVTALATELEGDKLCCVCMDAPISCLLLPCRHRCLCDACAAAVHRCPLCRTDIEERMTIYE